jgi:hypothetical protein
MRRFLDVLLAALLTAGVTVAVFFLRVIPRRDEKAREDSRALAEKLKQRVEAAKAERAAKVEKAVAVVEQQAEAAKAEDSVDVANRLIGGD